MKYDFTKRVDRKETGSAKWEEMYKWNPNVEPDILPMSVADMEFQAAPEITRGLKKYLDEAILGYTIPYPSFLDAVIQWQKERHNWDIQPEWIVNTPGVVTAFYGAIRTLSQKDEGVIIFRPVYHPFGQAIADNHRTEVNVPLIHENGAYEIDYDAFEEAAANPQNKILLFCSPHNPVGRVWRRDELEKIAEIAIKHNLYVISDEIWYDFVMPGYTHTVLATVDERLKERLITCTAPSKSFNLAGMMLSNIIIENPELRDKLRLAMMEVRSDMVGILGYKACELAYTKSQGWLDELIQVIYHNSQLVETFLAEHCPEIKTTKMEGTYVMWLDFRGLGMTNEELETFLHHEAQFFTDEGYIFGAEGSGFERINLALPTNALLENMNRLLRTLKNIKKSN